MEGIVPDLTAAPAKVTLGSSGENVASTPKVGKPEETVNGSTTIPPPGHVGNGFGIEAHTSIPSPYQAPFIRQTPNASMQGPYRPFNSTPLNPVHVPTSTTESPGVLHYRPPTLNSETEKRYSSMEKGKGRIPSPPPNGTHAHINRHIHPENQNSYIPARHGTGTNGAAEVPKTNVPTPHVTINPLATLPLSQIDQDFEERVKVNSAKPVLGRDIKGRCPVWANTRRGLQSALEYMRNPIKTAGASVDISPGGMARGIILEGETPSALAFWGKGEEGGTLILPIGKPRARRRAGTNPEIPMDIDKTPMDIDETPLDIDETPIAESDEALVKPLSLGNHLPIPTNSQKLPISSRQPESQEIEALLLTHRARTPIAVAVAHDYPQTPFCLPRPFCVLGWFWIIDAWVEPVAFKRKSYAGPGSGLDADDDRVVWKFRFEYQFDEAEAPWWQRVDEVAPRRAPVISSKDITSQWQLAPYGPTTSIMSAEDIKRIDGGRELVDRDVSTGKLFACQVCNGISIRSFHGDQRCLNENCRGWDVAVSRISQNIGSFSGSMPGIPRERITAESLRMELRPPEPENWETRVTQAADHGREYWTGWVCGACGCANERKKWYGWNCDSCRRLLYPKHWTYSADRLRGPLRPVSTGPRPDDGLASWPFEVSHAWTLFNDDVKVVRHGVEAGFGNGTVIYHSLNHEGPILARRRINVNDLFVDLQRTLPLGNKKTTTYRRHFANPKTARMCERYLSPFYTLLLGPDPAPAIESLPTAEKSIPWHEADSTFLDLADLINERAGQIFPGEPEFNSLLVAVTPPGLSASQAPRLYITANSYMSITFLGSDGILKFRRPAGSKAPRGKQGQITCQHGDVVGVQTGSEALEVIVQQEGFGIFCIGRQIYQLEKEASDKSISIVHNQDPLSRKGKSHVTNKPPPRPTKPLHIPLTYWYIGPFPLDPENPMKVQPGLQIHPADISMPTRPTRLDDPEYNGIEVITNPEIPRLHDPPHIPGEKNGRKRKITDQSESTEGSEKVKVKAKPRKSAVKVTWDEKSVEGASPAKKKGRKSGVVAPKT